MNKQLKMARIDAELTQKQLAERVGITNKYLSQLECGGARNPTKQAMERIAKELNKTVQELFFNE